MTTDSDPTTRTETITGPDGSFAGHLTLPPGGSGPGIVLLQEIFGVNEYLISAAARYAALGYVVLCPDLYWRIQPGTALPHTDQAMGQAFELVGRLDLDLAVLDIAITAEHLRALPEVTGPIALAGFCLGGSLAYAAAPAARPACVVSYYGTVVTERPELLGEIDCPVLIHFGGSDPFIPRDQVAVVEAAAESHDDVEVVVQEAGGHAFDNNFAPGFHHPEAAAAAWQATTGFLSRHLPADTPA